MKRMVATIAALCMVVGVGAALSGPLRAPRVASGSAAPMGSRNVTRSDTRRASASFWFDFTAESKRSVRRMNSLRMGSAACSSIPTMSRSSTIF